MKKKLFIIILIILSISIYFIYGKISLNHYINSTIQYKDQINYSTNINLNMKTKKASSEMDYDIVRSSNIKKIILSNKVDNELKYRIIRYKEKKNNKEVTYIYNDKKLNKAKKDKEIFYIRYEMLENGKIKKVSNNEYIIKMKSYDAYNMIYPKNVVSQSDTNKNIEVTLSIDKKNNFIKKIYYKIDDMGDNSMTYIVNIENRNINNHDKIKLPFKN